MKRTAKPTLTLKPWAIVAYFGLYAIDVVILLTWLTPEDRFVDLNAIVPGIYSHTTNLVISSVFVLAYGLARLLTGGTMREITVVTLLVIAANYGYELFLPLWNVPDAVDANYGAVGSLVSLGVIALIQRYGLTTKTPAPEQAPAEA